MHKNCNNLGGCNRCAVEINVFEQTELSCKADFSHLHVNPELELHSIHLLISDTIFVSLKPPFDPNQPPPCLPWNSHEGMWSEQRDPGNWSGGPPREGSPWNGPGPGGSDSGPSSWNSYDPPTTWGNQPDQPPWGQREPPFPPRMQACGLRFLFCGCAVISVDTVLYLEIGVCL